MKSGKVIDISKSSLVSLKAELSRKQEEVKKVKGSESYIKLPPKPKETVKANVGVEERNKQDLQELQPEEIDLLKKSREVLEVKSRLYDELQKGKLVSEEGKSRYLVDFNQKGTQTQAESNDPVLNEKAESSDDDFMESDFDESEWVEYTDCLGRTRKCHRSELAEMKEIDAKMSKEVCRERQEEKEVAAVERPPELVSSDMERERFRQKWEEQEQELLNKKDIHYEDILFDGK